MARKTQKTNAELNSTSADAEPGRDTAGAAAWPDVDLGFMEKAIPTSPSFPVSTLPPAIEPLVSGLAAAKCITPAYVAPAVLGVFSGAIGNRWRIAVTPDEAEPLALFILNIGEPGSNRSSAIRVAPRALREAEAAIIADLAKAGPTASAEVSKARHQDSVRAIRQIVRERGMPFDIDDEEPPPPPLIVSDASGAGFIDEMQHDARGRVLVTDEFGSGSLAGPAESARTVLLKAFDGDRFDQRLKSSGHVSVPALLLTIIAATHPDRIQQIVGHIRNGACARFLWTYPAFELVHELPKESGPVNEFGKLAVELARSGGSNRSDRFFDTIELPADAHAKLTAASKAFTTGLDDLSGPLRDVHVRARQHALRLAGLFAVVEATASGKRPDAVTGEHVERAIALMGDFFLPMAARALSTTAYKPESPALQLARHLRRLGKATVNARDDIQRGTGSPLRELAAIGDALRELQLRGLIRPVERLRVGAGRPARDWMIHPALLDESNN
ncbi:DUF3987 domain-containing protein [Bradyrhizobium sp.]|uniref:DUF3987 domain-containing protein n=1 Tax=Bradyrhizobium sp. TaxID=376 RepID=UPI00391BA918